MPDASGTPSTNYLIPKFNTAVDPPSGKGTNTIVDFIDTLLKNTFINKPAGVATGETPVWNSGTGTWDRSSVTRLGATSLGSGTPDATKFLRGDGTWASGLTGPPGSQIDYAEVTSNQTSVATTAATATAVITGNPITYDGSTPVWIAFQAVQAWHSVANTGIFFEIYDGSTDLGVVAASTTAATANSTTVFGARKLTPSAASHTYSIRMWSIAAGTATAQAGAGGAGLAFPMFLRITRA